MSNQKRNMPSWKAIKMYWRHYLVEIGKFDSVEELFSGDYCFACGMVDDITQKPHHTHRAHIVSKFKGGTDSVENIHLLCPTCHKASEFLDGTKYDEWLGARTFQDAMVEMVAKYEPHTYMRVMQKLGGHR